MDPCITVPFMIYIYMCRDQDGSVSKIDPAKDFFESEHAVVGYMENIA